MVASLLRRTSSLPGHRYIISLAKRWMGRSGGAVVRESSGCLRSFSRKLRVTGRVAWRVKIASVRDCESPTSPPRRGSGAMAWHA